MKYIMGVFATLALSIAIPAAAETDQQIKQHIIRESIASYPGNCPCPYNTDRAGRSCGRRSAYSRRGGYAPLCYASDVSKEMVDEYRERHKKQEKKAASAK